MNLTDILLGITEKLELSDTQLSNIEKSYRAVGEWLNESETIKQYGKVTIFPQGSVGLGTVVKPINGEYDVDLVLYLDNASIPAKQLKQLVGNRLKENETYKRLLDDEGKRCWTLIYSDSLNYHMDILPTKKDISPVGFSGIKSILATNKDEYGTYYFKSTNPSGYLNWFLTKAKRIQLRDSYELKPLNEYPHKNNLQKIVQLLKRHRDVYFDKKNITDDLPISIIITTLAALAYEGETDLFNGLYGVAHRMNLYVEDKNNITYVKNPVDPRENFAERWNENNNKKRNYYMWQSDLVNDLKRIKSTNSTNLAMILQRVFGEKIVVSVYDSLGESLRSLREEGHLKMDNHTGKLNDSKGEGVKPHTFYGK